jgi:hypothetical protein
VGLNCANAQKIFRSMADSVKYTKVLEMIGGHLDDDDRKGEVDDLFFWLNLILLRKSIRMDIIVTTTT